MDVARDSLQHSAELGQEKGIEANQFGTIKCNTTKIEKKV